MITAKDLTDVLEAATSEHRLLEHPFYKAWAAGELSLEDLAYYSTQYWRQVEAFPQYLKLVSDRLPEGVARSVVLDNLSDEVDDDHLGLWRRFAESVGASGRTLDDMPLEAETEDCVKGFRSACGGASPAFALGMLYGYESQTPEVAATKITGLRDHYGIEGEGLDYFELHGELDVEHASELAGAIASLGDDAVAEAEAGARAGAEAIYGLLTGVARVRGCS
jgi:pyrroloquinoline-quinone synthase